MLVISGLGTGGAPVPPVTPSASFLVYAMKGGSDGPPGNGSDEFPFATPQHSLNFAGAIAGVGPTQAALVLLGPGQYAQNVTIPPFVILAALEPGNTVVIGTGVGNTVALSAAWVGNASSPFGGVEELFMLGDAVIDFTGVASFSTFVFGSASFFGGVLNVTGDPAQGGSVSLEAGVEAGPVSVVGASLFTSDGTGFTLSLASTAAQPAAWIGQGSFTLGAGVTLDATAGQNVSADLIATGVRGSVTLHDGGGGVTSYHSDAIGIPETIVLTGGAAYPVRHTGPNAIDVGLVGQVITTALVGGQLVAVWAANGAAVTWADDLATSTNVAQWVSAIHGANGLGGLVPLGDNVTLGVVAGGHTAIDLTAANAAFGFGLAHSWRAPVFDAIAAGPVQLGGLATLFHTLAPIEEINGTAAAPSYTFTADPSTGMYYDPVTGNTRWAALGVFAAEVLPSGGFGIPPISFPAAHVVPSLFSVADDSGGPGFSLSELSTTNMQTVLAPAGTSARPFIDRTSADVLAVAGGGGTGSAHYGAGFISNECVEVLVTVIGVTAAGAAGFRETATATVKFDAGGNATFCTPIGGSSNPTVNPLLDCVSDAPFNSGGGVPSSIAITCVGTSVVVTVTNNGAGANDFTAFFECKQFAP
jgi:hypothetical protein